MVRRHAEQTTLMLIDLLEGVLPVQINRFQACV